MVTKEFNQEEFDKKCNLGDFYSKDLTTKQVVIIPKKYTKEIQEVIKPENWDELESYEKEDILAGTDFILSIIVDILLKKDYSIIEPKLNKSEEGKARHSSQA